MEISKHLLESLNRKSIFKSVFMKSIIEAKGKHGVEIFFGAGKIYADKLTKYDADLINNLNCNVSILFTLLLFSPF